MFRDICQVVGPRLSGDPSSVRLARCGNGALSVWSASIGPDAPHEQLLVTRAERIPSVMTRVARHLHLAASPAFIVSLDDVPFTCAGDSNIPGRRVRHLPYLAYEVDRLADGRIIYFCPPHTAWLHDPGTGDSWRFTAEVIQWDVVTKLHDASGPVARALVRRLVRALQAVRKGDEPDELIPRLAGGGVSTARIGWPSEVLLRMAKWTGRMTPYVVKDKRTFKNPFLQYRRETASILPAEPLKVRTTFLGVLPNFSLTNASAREFCERMMTVERLFYELDPLDGGWRVLLSKPGDKIDEGERFWQDGIVWLCDPTSAKPLWKPSYDELADHIGKLVKVPSVCATRFADGALHVYAGAHPREVLGNLPNAVEGAPASPEALLHLLDWIWEQEDCDNPPPRFKGRWKSMEEHILGLPGFLPSDLHY
jgi:hypothetical protein